MIFDLSSEQKAKIKNIGYLLDKTKNTFGEVKNYSGHISNEQAFTLLKDLMPEGLALVKK